MSKEFIVNVQTIVEENVKTLLEHFFQKFPKLAIGLSEAAGKRLERFADMSREEVMKCIEVEANLIYTRTGDYERLNGEIEKFEKAALTSSSAESSFGNENGFSGGFSGFAPAHVKK